MSDEPRRQDESDESAAHDREDAAQDHERSTQDRDNPAQETRNPAREGPDTTPMGQTDVEQDEKGTTDPGGA